MQDSLSLAWNLILKQHFERAKEVSRQKAGLCIFKMLHGLTPEGNCHFFFAERGSDRWDTILNLCPEGKEVGEKYDSENMIAIYVQVPTSNGDVGNIRLFNIDAGEVKFPPSPRKGIFRRKLSA